MCKAIYIYKFQIIISKNGTSHAQKSTDSRERQKQTKKIYTVMHCLSGSCTSHKYSQINYSEWRHLIVREQERDLTQNI